VEECNYPHNEPRIFLSRVHELVLNNNDSCLDVDSHLTWMSGKPSE